MRALVVDDDLITRMILQEALSGYAEVHTCVDGSEAVQACRRALERGEPYDLVCLDLHMPIMGGIEALNCIRRDEEGFGRLRTAAATRIVVTTASNDSETIDQAFGGLCDAYVVKPIDIGEFNNIVGCLFPIENQV